MSNQYQDQLQRLQRSEHLHILQGICHGIEREGLRVTPEARLSRKVHPEALGKALTHPYITTDYSEALLEFITPVHCRLEDTMDFLEELHSFTCQHSNGELLWAGSMPAILEGDQNIPVAQYGSSNIGRMKSVYREGLAHRYGKPMQTIAGIHYNFSLPDEFWELQGSDGQQKQDLQAVRSEGYLALIRNFRRYAWLLMYLFGASPAVSRSFFADKDCHYGLQPLDEDTLYGPYATSLRMSDLGYTNNAQSSLNICYNDLEHYVDSLSKAIQTPYQAYEDIGLKKDGKYLQLNTNLLQIENEYYSTIRPKRVSRSGEKPVTALRNDGVEYIEVRCLDINPFEPLGMSLEDAHFLDIFLVYCALKDSPAIDSQECQVINENFSRVVSEGRKPGLELNTGEESISLASWGEQLLNDMQAVAELLDQSNDTRQFSESIRAQQAKLDNVALTPSARIAAAMRNQKMSYIELLLSLSTVNTEAFRQRPMDQEREFYLHQVAERSRMDQQMREAEEDQGFDEFLANYFASE